MQPIGGGNQVDLVLPGGIVSGEEGFTGGQSVLT